jgi:hypothetical protein
MNYKVFLDDIRFPYWIYDNPDEWIVIRNDIDFKKFVSENKDNISTISWDNDLGVDKNGNIIPDGYSLLNWLIDNDIYIKNIIVHSDNVIASEQIFGKATNWFKYLISENILKKGELKVLKRPAMYNFTDIYLEEINI